jgi:hypothetical protein
MGSGEDAGARMTEIPVGRYVVVRTPGVIAWAIRASTHSNFNHVFVTGPGGLIAEAVPSDVRLSLLSEYAGMQACANLGDPMTPQQGAQVWAAAKAMAGHPYDFPALLALAAMDLGWHWNAVFRLLGAGPWRICSQLAVLAGQAAKPPLDWLCAGDTLPDEVTPAALARRPGVVPVSL